MSVDYKPLLSYLHSASPQISLDTYNDYMTKEKDTGEDRESRTEYSRLFSEIEFLTRHWDPRLIAKPTLVVQGSYPNSHYVLLKNLFPQIILELWDAKNTQSLPSMVDDITIYTEDLTATGAADLYRGKEVLFISYVPLLGLDLDAKQIYSDIWENGLTYQSELVQSILPSSCNLTFCLPLKEEERDFREYYKGYITLPVLTPKLASLEDRVTRCTVERQDGKYVLCDYSTDWYDGVLYYANLASKKGKLCRNNITRTSSFEYKNEKVYCGIDLCRILDIIHKYTLFTRMQEMLLEETVLDRILKIMAYMERVLENANIFYSLREHSLRYIDKEEIEEEERIKKIERPSDYEKIISIITSPEESFSDLAL